MARSQSVDAAVALNELKTAYWEYRTFRADLLPEVNLTGTLPNYNKSYSSYQNSNGSYSFVRNSALGLSGELSIDQNIWLTGGKLSLTSSLDYMEAARFRRRPPVHVRPRHPETYPTHLRSEQHQIGTGASNRCVMPKRKPLSSPLPKK